jgi:hypothetical protein
MLGAPTSAGQLHARLVVQHAPHRGESRLEGIGGEPLQCVVDVEAGGQGGDAGEAHQRERQLERDPPPQEPDEGAHGQASGSRR